MSCTCLYMYMYMYVQLYICNTHRTLVYSVPYSPSLPPSLTSSPPLLRPPLQGPSGGLGVSVAGGSDNPHVVESAGIFITKLIPDTPASKDGALRYMYSVHVYTSTLMYMYTYMYMYVEYFLQCLLMCVVLGHSVCVCMCVCVWTAASLHAHYTVLLITFINSRNTWNIYVSMCTYSASFLWLGVDWVTRLYL